jgi:hypothetical protein
MMFFWVSVDSNVSEKHTVFIFRAEVAILGSGLHFPDHL